MMTTAEEEMMILVHSQIDVLEDIREQTNGAPGSLHEFADAIALGEEFDLPSGAQLDAGYAAGLIQGLALAHGVECREFLERARVARS